MGAEKLAKLLESRASMTKGTNDLEYFEKIDKLLEQYEKRTDARTKEMSYMVIKLLRIIDGRDYCTDTDLKIYQYMLENIDNKIEVADTDTFKVNGPHFVNEDDIQESNMDDMFNYQQDIGAFQK